MVEKVKLITRKLLDGHPITQQLSDFQHIYGLQNYLSYLPQLWQSFTLPVHFKNGNHLLLNEKITIYSSNKKIFFSKIELYLLNERISKSQKKYIVILELRIYQRAKLIGTVEITLLSEVSWNENCQTN